MPVRKSVKGILLDPQGWPVADAVVMVTGSSGSVLDIASSSNEKGEFYLDNILLPGSFSILINHLGTSVRKTVGLQETDTVFSIHL